MNAANQMEGAKMGAEPMRPMVAKAVVLCLAVAVAPWLTGGQEPIAMLISGFALLLGSLLVWRQPVSRVLRRGPLAWVFGLLLGLGLLSLLWTASQYSTWIWVVHWALAGLVFRLTYSVAGELRLRTWLVRAYLLSVAIFAAYAVWLYLTGSYNRLTGTFYWANPAAAYLLPAVLMAVDKVRITIGRRQLAWSGGAIGLLATFLLADSRGATAVLLFVLALFLLLSSLNKRFWVHFLFIAILGYGLSVGLTSLSKIITHGMDRSAPGARLKEVVQGESTSGSDRIYYLESAFNMWFDHPVAGVGAGAYGDIHPQYQKGPSQAATNVHNEYAQILAELGIAGAVLLAALLLVLFVGCVRGLIGRPELMPVAVGLAGLLLHFGLDIDARYPALLGLAAMFMGLLYAQREQPSRKASWRWPVLSLLVLVPVVSLYESEVWAERGRAAQSDGQLEVAAADFEAAQTPVVFNPDYLNAQGVNLYAMGLSSVKEAAQLEVEALEKARIAQRLDPHDSQHHQLEGRVLVAQGEYKEAERALREALRLDGQNHPEYAGDLAAVLLRQGRIDEGVGVAQAMLVQYPASVRVRRLTDETLPGKLADLEALVGNVALSAGRLDEARAAAERGLAIDKTSLRVRALKRQVELRSAAQ